MSFLDNLKKKSTELAQQAQALGGEALAKGKELANQAQANPAFQKTALQTKFALALDRIALGNSSSVEAKVLDVHTQAMKDPEYAQLFNAYAHYIQAPKNPLPSHDSGNKIRDALNSGLDSLDRNVTEGKDKLRMQNALLKLAIK